MGKDKHPEQGLFPAAPNQASGVGEGAVAAQQLAFTIAVVDGGGHLLGLLRQDAALLGSLDVAQVKARTAVLFGTATKNLPGLTPLATPMTAAVPYPIALLPGGVPIRHGGRLLGGIGVGGATGEQDDEAAQAGLAAVLELLDQA